MEITEENKACHPFPFYILTALHIFAKQNAAAMNIQTQSIYHIILSTLNNENTLVKNGQRVLFKYIWEHLKNKNCELLRINGTANHLHLAVNISPIIPLDALIKDIKQSSTDFIGESHLFPAFAGWQDGYTAFTHSFKEKKELIDYIKKQEEYHQKSTFEEEISQLIKMHGLA